MYEKIKATFLGGLLLTICFGVSAQSVGINVSGNNPDESAILDVNTDGLSPKKGVLLPRMTSNERDVIVNPAEGLLIYNTESQCYEGYNEVANQWVAFGCIEVDMFTCGTDKVVDIDNNEYETLEINGQCWMKENLRVTKLNDGILIHDGNGDSNAAWGSLTIPAYCYYGGSPDPNDGTFYNWQTVGTDNICPTGWHVPSDMEWCNLEEFLEPGIDPSCNLLNQIRGTEAGKHLKSTTGWANGNIGNGNGDNSSGFTALPVGSRGVSDGFWNQGSYTAFWTATPVNVSQSYIRILNSNFHGVRRNADYANRGFSIRCIKD